MQKKLVLLMVMAISSSLLVAGLAQAQEQGDSIVLFCIINKLDISASSMRKGDSGSAKAAIAAASAEYKDSFSLSVSGKDSSLDSQIIDDFNIVSQTPSEAEIFSLRSDVFRAAALIGVGLSPIYAYSIFIVPGIGFAAAVFVTLIMKRMINWEVVKQNKIKIAEFQKEYRAAMKKRDMKLVHKLQQRQPEINKLSMQNASQNFKPTIIYMVPLFLVYAFLVGGVFGFEGIFGGWVVAWMPFIRIDLPFIGSLVVFGVGWWYFLTYLGFSQILRKVVIGD